jgi:TonB family protein
LAPNPRSRGPRSRINPFTSAICIAIIVAAAATRTDAAPQADGLGNLVFSITEAIVEATKADKVRPRVRVESFRGLDGDANELGVELANRISDLLRQSSKTSLDPFFYVLDHMAETSSADNQPCDEKHPWPDILVKGSIDELAGQLSLRVTATRTSSTRPIFDRSVSLKMDPAMEASMAQRLTSGGESEAWLGPGWDPDKDPKSKVFKGEPKSENVTPPSCIDCPRAGYTDGASMAKIQGEIRLRLLVSQDGDPLKINLIDGLPCGLNRSAIQAVANWKLHPAKASDGTPIEVWQEVDITLQPY